MSKSFNKQLVSVTLDKRHGHTLKLLHVSTNIALTPDQTNKHNFNSFSLHLSFFQIPTPPKKLSCQKKIKVPIKTLRIFKKKNVIQPAQNKCKKIQKFS